MIAERAGVFTARFYSHLFEIDPSVARLFNGVNMRAQEWKLAQTLGVVVQALDDLDTLLPALAALGARHKQYGVEDAHFETVGEALLKAFSDTLRERFTPEARTAWTDAYTFVASEMRQALAREGSPRLPLE